MDTVEGLNPEQNAAAMHEDGPMLVVAGAGTGKTRVITERVAALLKKGKARPGEILALTFTEKAAREMEERLYGLIGWQSFEVGVMTFHAFGAELIGRFASHIGRSVRGGLINESQKALLLLQHIGEVPFAYYGPQSDMLEFLEGMVGYINALQNGGVTPEAYLDFVAKLRADGGSMHPREVDEQSDLAQIYALYERVKAATGTYDYHDQIELPLRILRTRPNLAERLNKEYRYVLVDEYQDTNGAQDELIRAIVGRSGNLFAVGDDDQAIYGFRGADVNNILGFAEHFEIARPVVLTRNYRSGQAILDASYRLIQNNNPNRLEQKLGIDKRLVAGEHEAKAEFVLYETALDEYDGVAEAVNAKITGGLAPSEISVLAATHAPLKAMAKVLGERGIPYAISTAESIFNQPELTGLWYLCKWICGLASEDDITHIMLGPYMGWTASSFRRVAQSADGTLAFEEALRLDGTPASQDAVRRLDGWRALAAELSAGRTVFEIVFTSGFANKWREQASEKGRFVKVFDDLQKWFGHIQDFENVNADGSLRAYLAAYSKPPSLEVTEIAGDPDGVKLLTVHAAKGLEFDSVFVVACTARNWTKSRGITHTVPESLSSRVELPAEHEYRRLMYVAATRAKRHLILSSPKKSLGGTKQVLSPYVVELLGEVAEVGRSSLSQLGLEKMWQKIQHYYPLNNNNDQLQRLPFETADGWLEVSVTSLARYEFCPFEFYLAQVLQLPQPFGPQMAFGNALHRAIEIFNKGKIAGQVVAVDELHSMVDEMWSNKGYESAHLAQADLALAHKTLDSFVQRELNEKRQVTASELPIALELPEAKLRLRGKIDAIYTDGGGVQIIDYKTGRSKYDDERLSADAKTSLQLRTYALAHEMLNGAGPERVVLDYIVTGGRGEAQLTPLIYKNHRAKLGALAGAIRERKFSPTQSGWHQCPALRYYGTGELDEILDEALVKPDNG